MSGMSAQVWRSEQWLTTRRSYDLDQDTKLSEETTVLVESYTVSDYSVLNVKLRF